MQAQDINLIQNQLDQVIEDELTHEAAKNLLPQANFYEDELFFGTFQEELFFQHRREILEASEKFNVLFDNRERERLRCIVKDCDTEIQRNSDRLKAKQQQHQKSLLRKLEKQHIKYNSKEYIQKRIQSTLKPLASVKSPPVKASDLSWLMRGAVHQFVRK